MNRPLTLDGDVWQTIINTMAWMQTNAREGIYVKLSDYHGKSEEDVMVWCKEVDRVATANNWRRTNPYYRSGLFKRSYRGLL